ncbi:MAG: DUF881 domain-containing protein [Clostridia bacterium]|nr:DUF881 domain-containing protein [Clostridia bacterium]
MKQGKNVAIALVCIILGAVISWQYKSIDYNQKNAMYENKRAEDLKDELLREKRNNDELTKRFRELERENKEYEDARGNINETVKKINKEIEKATIIAGLTQVKGKGIIVTVDNSNPIKIDENDSFSYEVTEENILNLLNELRASDAIAISINEERIIASSEVRKVDKNLLVNGRSLSPPFEVKVIADPDKLENSLRIIGGVLEQFESSQLNVNIKKSDEVIIPKVRDDVIKTDLLTPISK